MKKLIRHLCEYAVPKILTKIPCLFTQVRCDGAGTLDYITEFLVNILPNLLRYQIMDALENPAKTRIQQMMNKIDVEKVIKEKVVEFEEKGMNITMDFDFKF